MQKIKLLLSAHIHIQMYYLPLCLLFHISGWYHTLHHIDRVDLWWVVPSPLFEKWARNGPCLRHPLSPDLFSQGQGQYLHTAKSYIALSTKSFYDITWKLILFFFLKFIINIKKKKIETSAEPGVEIIICQGLCVIHYFLAGSIQIHQQQTGYYMLVHDFIT